MEHLALNVYLWGGEAQDGFLSACLGPAVRELRADGHLRRFWFYRFDVRGPHVGVLLSAPRGGGDALRDRLGAAVAAHLEAHPCTTPLSPGELRERHDACRGAELCAIDAEPGFAAPNTFRFAPHPADGFLLGATASVAAEDELWGVMGEVALWSIARVGEGRGAAWAPRWIAAVDGALRRAGAPAEACWRYYATSLAFGLSERLRADEEGVAAALPGLLGERNLAALSRIWDEVEAAPPPWAPADRLAALATADDGRAPRERWRLLRTLNHSVLAQLGQPASHRIPLVLYAWMRSLSPCVAAG